MSVRVRFVNGLQSLIGGSGRGHLVSDAAGAIGRFDTGSELGTAWTPVRLDAVDLWLDADDAAAVTRSGTAVTGWLDKSGKGRHLSQATAGYQPAWVAGAHNGRSAVRFDGGDTLGGGDVLDLGSGNLSVMAVTRDAAASGGSSTAGNALAKATSTTAAGQWLLGRNGLFVHLDAQRDARDAANPTVLQMVGGTLDRSVGVTSHRNGAQVAQVTAGFPFGATSYNTTASLLAGARNTSSSPSNPLTGDVCEIVLSLAAWSEAERQKVEGYLAHRWGLQGGLPAAHPYRHHPPLAPLAGPQGPQGPQGAIGPTGPQGAAELTPFLLIGV